MLLRRQGMKGLHTSGSKHTANRCNAARKLIVVAAANPAPTAVISGCSSGIGRETALLLAEKGWKVFAGARSQPDLDVLQQLHPCITPIHLDVTSHDSIAAAAQQVQAAVDGGFGVQLLVNNAGVGLVAPAEFVPLDEFRGVFDVNVFGALATSQAFLPLLRQGQQKGRIINISSVAGHLCMPFWAAYCSSKAALESISDCLRYELAPLGVAVVLIKPGPVATPIWERSRAKSRNVVDSLPPAAQDLYGGRLKSMDLKVRQSEETALSVDKVVQLIYQAATCPKPKSRYHIGDRAALTHWAKRLLPDKVWETIMMQSFA